MLSFAQVLQLLSEAVRLGKHTDSMNNTTHVADVGNHKLQVYYRQHADIHPTTHKIIRKPKHYSMSFTVNGTVDRADNMRLKNRITPEENLSVYHHVTKSMQDFVKDHKPKAITFSGDNAEKHHHWEKIGPLLAKKLKGKFKPGKNDKQHKLQFDESLRLHPTAEHKIKSNISSTEAKILPGIKDNDNQFLPDQYAARGSEKHKAWLTAIKRRQVQHARAKIKVVK